MTTTTIPPEPSTSPSLLVPQPQHITLLQQGAVPVLVQASAQTLREELPHNSWLDDYKHVVEGKVVGYAIRETGEDLVYVKFPLIQHYHGLKDEEKSQPPEGKPAKLHAVSFTCPKKFLVPVAVPTDGSIPTPKTVTMITASSSAVANNNKNGPKDVSNLLLQQSLVSDAKSKGKDGKPLLCVVCGAWNTEGGQLRKSGFKCKNCIGVKSVARLKEAYKRIAEGEEDE